MALRTDEQLDIDRPDNTSLMAGTEGAPVLQDGRKVVTRAGAVSADSDYDINGIDLADGVFSTGEADIGGTETVAIAVESTDGNQFAARVYWTDDQDNILYIDDESKDSDLQGTDVRVNVEVAGDWFHLEFVDKSGAVNNRIRGTVNVH